MSLKQDERALFFRIKNDPNNPYQINIRYGSEITLTPGGMSQWFKYDGEKACTISPKGFGREDTTCCSVEFRYNANESSPLDITDIVTTDQSDDSFFDVVYDKNSKEVIVRYRVYDSSVGYARTTAEVYFNSSILSSPLVFDVNY